jgi:hypothetical protein
MAANVAVLYGSTVGILRVGRAALTRFGRSTDSSICKARFAAVTDRKRQKPQQDHRAAFFAGLAAVAGRGLSKKPRRPLILRPYITG